MRGLEADTRQALDTYLRSDSRRPIAVGLSGGGDSLALTLLADAWARDVGRELLILNVDHGLQTASAAWARTCAAIAARLDRPFRALAWTGEKPTTGLPAAARRARHRLLAEVAREAGAAVVLLGHTADDRAEAAAMRAAGGTTPDARVWSPSPVWPEGRGVFLLRPLLNARRADLCAWLAARGETWIDDPANTDLRYARSRARATDPVTAPPTAQDVPLSLAAQAQEQASVVTMDRAALARAPLDEARRFVGLAAVCAGGGERLPSGARVVRATEALLSDGPLTTTLAGARIEAADGSVRFMREAGEARRGGLASARLPTVWDGRFVLSGAGEVRRAAGLVRQLSPADQMRLQTLPASARGAMPVIIGEDGVARLAPFASLVGDRLRAAAGLIQREPA